MLSNVERHFCRRQNLFDRMEVEAGISVPQADRYYPFRMTYDIEAMLRSTNLPPSTDNTSFTSQHELMSVSLCSNVPGFETPECFVVSSTAAECVDRFVTRAETIAEVAERLVEKKLAKWLTKLRRFVEEREKREEKYSWTGFSNYRTYNTRANLCEMEKELAKWMRRVPIVGFNSQKYDINVMKAPLLKRLMDDLDFVVKKNDAMTCVQTDRLRFLDAVNYISPGYNYASYLAAYGVEEKKGVFPYEWMDDMSKLEQTFLPPREAFYSSLRKQHITSDEYESVVSAWESHKMETIRDLLIWYNNLDVHPFLIALETQSQVYRSRGIDMLKEAISLPGLSTSWMFSVAGERPTIREAFRQCRSGTDVNYDDVKRAVIATQRVRLIGEEDESLYDCVRDNMVGGPCEVYHRRHVRGETKIRETVYGSNSKLCSEVVGYDANALYLYCAAGPMGVGDPRILTEANGYASDKTCYGKTALGWLAWQEFITDELLQTAANLGEKKIGRHGLPVDGFCAATNTVYQFNGCFWHGHGCSQQSSKDLGNVPAAERKSRTELKAEYVRALGYSLVSVWECEWTNTVSSSSTIKCFLKAVNDASYGTERGRRTMAAVLEDVREGKIFGFVECDLHVPPHLRDYFSEMSPIFRNVELSREDLSEHMLEHALSTGQLSTPRRCLVGTMGAKKILLLSELLQWYMVHGIVVTRVYKVVRYNVATPFKSFADSVTEARRKGDIDESEQLLASTAKLVGNSFYGKTITDKTKHRNVTYTDDERKVSTHIAGRRFSSLNTLGDDLYETCRYKSKVSRVVSMFLFFFEIFFPLTLNVTPCVFHLDQHGRSGYRRLYNSAEG